MSNKRTRSDPANAGARKKQKTQSPIYRHTFTVRGVPEPTGPDAQSDEAKVAYFNKYMQQWKAALTTNSHLNIANFVFQVERGHEQQKLHLQGFIHIGGRGKKSQGIRPATLAKKLEAIAADAGIAKDPACNQWVSCQPVSNNGVYAKAMEKYVMKDDTRVPGILPVGKRKIYRGNGEYDSPFSAYGRITIQPGRYGPLIAKRFRSKAGILIGTTSVRVAEVMLRPYSPSRRSRQLANIARRRCNSY